jgi:hypothetical protein
MNTIWLAVGRSKPYIRKTLTRARAFSDGFEAGATTDC